VEGFWETVIELPNLYG